MPEDVRPPEQPVDPAARLREVIQGIDRSPFSAAAFSTLIQRITEHIGDLVTESVKVSKRHQADTGSTRHVDLAYAYLVSRPSRRWLRFLGILGGGLLGAALSNVVTLVVTGTAYSVEATLIVLGLAVAGTFLMALHLGSE